MTNKVYKIIEIVGTSSVSIEDAITKAIERSSNTVEHVDWFEVVQTRGYLESGKIKEYQVILKVGFKLVK